MLRNLFQILNSNHFEYLKLIAMTFLRFSYYLHIMGHSVRLLIHTREFVIENVYKANLDGRFAFYIQHEIRLWIVSFDVFKHSGCINDDLCIQYTVVYRPDEDTHEHHVLVSRNMSKVARVCVCFSVLCSSRRRKIRLPIRGYTGEKPREWVTKGWKNERKIHYDINKK